jgi:putative endopeptidase
MCFARLTRRDCVMLLGASLSGLAGIRSAPSQELPRVSPSREYKPWGFDLSGADLGIKAGDDFFRYSNGVWLDRAVISPDHDTNSVDNTLSDIVEGRIRDILMSGTNVEPSAREDAAKAGVFYSNFMDEPRAEALDANPITPFVRMVRRAENRADLAELMPKPFFGEIFSLSIGIDAKAPDKYAVVIGQAGLGLPDRDYYLTAQLSSKRAAYLAYIAHALSLIGWEAPNEFAAEILNFETAIAEPSWALTERQDSGKMYNPTRAAELAQISPFPWCSFFRGADLPELDRVVLAEVTAVQKIAAIYARTPIVTLKAWQVFHLVDAVAPYLSKRFVTANFQFHHQTLRGVAKLAERWKRGVRLVESEMGQAIGRVYVARYFTARAKDQIDDAVAQILLAMKERIERVDWMSAETKSKALTKLSRLKVKIGYPDEWRDYSGLAIHPNELLDNVRNARIFDWLRRVARLNLAVDRDEWDTTPQTVNTEYSSTLNEVVLPAGQLQAPYFDPAADPAVNYGGIGAAIGHELFHGFDDDGRKYDGAGALSNWWTNADAREFNARAAGLSRQYSSFEPLPGLHMNGDQTIGENIADLAGVLVALDAYHRSAASRSAPVLDGFTGDQRFYLSYAQSFRAKRTDEATRQLIISDSHPTEQYRVNGIVRNIDAWYQAFNVQPGDRLYLASGDRVRIW